MNFTLLFDGMRPQPWAGFITKSASPSDTTAEGISWGILGPESGELANLYTDRVMSLDDGTGVIGRRSFDEQRYSVLVALFGKDGRFRVWGSRQVVLQFKRLVSVEAGQDMFTDDVADCRTIELDGLPLDEATGFFVSVEIGYQRAVAFVAPAEPPGVRKPKLQPEEWAGMAANLIFHRERFAISEMQFLNMRAAGWFPFVSLPGDLVTLMRVCAECDRDWAVLDESVLRDLDGAWWKKRLGQWADSDVFRAEAQFAESAIRAIAAGDAIAAYQTVAPRVEGAAVRAFGQHGRWPKANVVLADILAAGQLASQPISTLFVKQFIEYLEDVHFAPFAGTTALPQVGRHSAAHGALAPDSIKLVHSVQTLLTLDQLFQYSR